MVYKGILRNCEIADILKAITFQDSGLPWLKHAQYEVSV